MDDETQRLIEAARQVIATERMLGSEFLPAGENVLPATEARAMPTNENHRQKAEALEAIDTQEVRACTRCGLSKGRTHTVFGEGSPDAELVFVGEGPGVEEDRQGRPFVGRAGELLTKMVHAMGLRREDVYICNMVKCRPPGNRSPTPEETQACWDYLVRQLQIIQPTVIVTLGNPSTQGLLDTRLGISKLRGQWQQLPMIGDGLAGIAVMPTFHPAFLLRQYTDENRRKVWDDLKKVMAKLGLETTQRG